MAQNAPDPNPSPAWLTSRQKVVTIQKADGNEDSILVKRWTSPKIDQIFRILDASAVGLPVELLQSFVSQPIEDAIKGAVPFLVLKLGGHLTLFLEQSVKEEDRPKVKELDGEGIAAVLEGVLEVNAYLWPLLKKKLEGMFEKVIGGLATAGASKSP